MLEALAEAFFILLTPDHFLHLAVGVVLGLIVGIFPGLGGIVGLSLLLPFLYGMDTISALAMLIGLVAVIPTSDTFTSVLMGIPGSSASQATVLDGFPLARQGHAAQALGAAFTASLFGGLFGAVVLTFFVQIARPIILAFGSAELFMLAVLGLSMVGVLAGRSAAKGIAACGLGLLLGSVGAAPATGEFRMILSELYYLVDGIPLVIVGLGIFAVPEIVDLLRRGQSIAEAATLGRGWIQGLVDTWRNRWLCVRCAGIGCLVGAIPGLGGSVVDWIAYGHVVQTSSDKSRYGKGDIRGVLAPESANNAKEGGGLVPTLLFGIPGSGSMAVFLGGLVLLGVQPGPALVQRDLGTTYAIVWSLALANVIGAGTCLVISPLVARLTTIRYTLMAPFMIMVICFAAFQATRLTWDLAFLFLVGLLGIGMKRFGWPRPAFLIGFVLAGQAETYLYQAVQFYGWGFVGRPGVLIIGAFTLLSVWLGARNSPHTRAEKLEGLSTTARDLRPQCVFAAAIMLCFVYGLYDGLQQSFLGGVFTTWVSMAMIGFSGIVVYHLLAGHTDNAVNYDLEADNAAGQGSGTAGPWRYVVWFAALLLASALVGFFIAIVAFFILFLRAEARASWARTLVLTGAAAAFLLLLADALVLDFPRGVLQDRVDLPWPIR
jgi:putative tricarboxylic transport membrane protein